MNITRTFHPVGHGAFYSERHTYTRKRKDDFIIVYDCGTKSAQKYCTNAIDNEFNCDDTIDILFISHLDEDHISQIKYLNSIAQIKSIILPLLYPDCINFVSSFLINTIGKHLKIIFVKPTEESDDDEQDIFIDRLDNIDVISSGRQIKVTNLNDWVFIPYNADMPKNRSDLKNTSGIDFEKLCSDSKYAIEKIDDRGVLKKAYENLRKSKSQTSNINYNSLLLYSGPINNDKYYRRYPIYYPLYRPFVALNNCAGCIYNGDSDLHCTNIKSVYKHVWDNVGTIQIPHHGSVKNFDSLQLKPMCACPMSIAEIILEKTTSFPCLVPIKKTKHPDPKVVIGIYNSKCIPVYVTRCVSTMYTDRIIKR